MITILGKGHITFHNFVNPMYIEDIRVKLRESDYEVPEDLNIDDAIIYFEAYGNKWINYEPLDSIVEFMNENNIKYTIRVTEYTEGEDGYYKSNEDDEERNSG